MIDTNKSYFHHEIKLIHYNEKYVNGLRYMYLYDGIRYECANMTLENLFVAIIITHGFQFSSTREHSKSTNGIYCFLFFFFHLTFEIFAHEVDVSFHLICHCLSAVVYLHRNMMYMCE